MLDYNCVVHLFIFVQLRTQLTTQLVARRRPLVATLYIWQGPYDVIVLNREINKRNRFRIESRESIVVQSSVQQWITSVYCSHSPIYCFLTYCFLNYCFPNYYSTVYCSTFYYSPIYCSIYCFLIYCINLLSYCSIYCYQLFFSTISFSDLFFSKLLFVQEQWTIDRIRTMDNRTINLLFSDTWPSRLNLAQCFMA